MKYRNLGIVFVLACAGIGFLAFPALPPTHAESSSGAAHSDMGKFAQGRHVFRLDTFGDPAFWGDALQLHQAIQGSKFGGVGPGLSPKTALAVGLKVDVDALPPSLIQELKNGQVDLNDPAVTLALLKLNSVPGVTGFFKPMALSNPSASNARSVTRPSTTHSRPPSDTGSTAGRIVISI